MAELADALDSGSSGCKTVQVQVLLSAPNKKHRFGGVFLFGHACWRVIRCAHREGENSNGFHFAHLFPSENQKVCGIYFATNSQIMKIRTTHDRLYLLAKGSGLCYIWNDSERASAALALSLLTVSN